MANTDPDFERMTDAELAEWQYAHKDQLDDELEVGEEVEVEVAKPLGTAMSFRLSEDEAVKIRRAASGLGMSLSEWVRQACLQTATVQEDSVRRKGGTGASDRSRSGAYLFPGFPGSQMRGRLRELHSMLRAMHEHTSTIRKAEESIEAVTTRTEQLIDSWPVEDVHAGSGGNGG